jgi:hypothetical protein
MHTIECLCEVNKIKSLFDKFKFIYCVTFNFENKQIFDPNFLNYQVLARSLLF